MRLRDLNPHERKYLNITLLIKLEYTAKQYFIIITQQVLYKSNRQCAAMNKQAEMSYKKVSKTKNIGKESPIT